jgi:hypothetical protein
VLGPQTIHLLRHPISVLLCLQTMRSGRHHEIMVPSPPTVFPAVTGAADRLTEW